MAVVRSGATRRGHNNLPAQTTVLYGREREVASLCALVIGDPARLVTLTGVGGCGKTRLALECAAAVAGSFKDGVWLIQLAPIADPSLVANAVASILGVR